MVTITITAVSYTCTEAEAFIAAVYAAEAAMPGVVFNIITDITPATDSID